MCSSDIFLGVIAIIFPPIAVWVKRGICSADSLINLALCCLGVLPGLIHAWYIIAKYPEPTEYVALDEENAGRTAHVTYYYVDRRGVRRQPAPPQRGYGTTDPMPRPADAPQPHQAAADPAQGPANGAEIPPSYEQAVQGDHKVQHSN